MLLKVYQKGDKWYRKEDNTLVGTYIQDQGLLKIFENTYGKHIFIEDTHNKIRVIYYGYYTSKRKFLHFCNKDSKECSGCPNYVHSAFCRYHTNASISKTAGFYLPTKK